MNKSIVKGVIIGVVAGILITGMVYFFPSYSCNDSLEDQTIGEPINCHRNTDLTPGLVAVIFIITTVVGGGISLFLDKKYMKK